MKKAKGLTKYCDLISLALGVVAICMIFLPAIVQKAEDPLTFSGLQVAFGYSETNGNLVYNYLAFSFMNLLPYILLLAGVVLLCLSAMGKSFKFVNLVVCCLFVVAGVFMFLTLSFVVPATNLGGYLNGINVENYALGVGSILGGIFAILAGVASGLKLLK